MNDIIHFFEGLGQGLQAAMGSVNPLPVLIIAMLIGFLQPKADRILLKATIAVALAFAVRALWPTLFGRPMEFPDFRYLDSIAQLFILFIIAYGAIGILGTLKTALRFEGKKA